MTADAAAELKLVSPPPGGLVRVGRNPRTIQWREPRTRLNEEDATPLLTGNRFDAPANEFRTVYFASTPYGAWIEKLAPFRPVADLVERINAALDPDEDEDPGFESDLRSGVLDSDFFDGLVVVEVPVHRDAAFIDVEDVATINTLNLRVGRPFLDQHQLGERFTRAAALSHDRRVTRSLALELYRLAHGAAAGLKWTSVHASGEECWALWDNAIPFMTQPTPRAFDLSTPELRNAAATLSVTIPDPPRPPKLGGVLEPW